MICESAVRAEQCSALRRQNYRAVVSVTPRAAGWLDACGKTDFSMKQSWTTCFRHGAIKRPVAGLLLLLWLHLLALAALPNLHTHAHRDADHADHQCAVTAIQQGKFVFHTPAPVVAAAPQAVVLEPARLVSVSLPPIVYRLAPGRAPPAA